MTPLERAQQRDMRSLIARLRAAFRLLANEEITPTGRRVLNRILDEAEGELDD